MFLKRTPMNLFEAKFVIDGIEQESTLKELVDACNGPYGRPAEYHCECSAGKDTVVDENLDPDLNPIEYSASRNEEYMESLLSCGTEGKTGINYAAEARQSIAKALTASLWDTPEQYMLDSMSLELEWDWDTESLGGYASLYRSVAAAADYAFEIGVKIASCRVTCRNRDMRLKSSCLFLKEDEEGCELVPVKTKSDKNARYVSHTPSFDEKIKDSTVLYIPFDTSDAVLGGSALAALLGQTGESTPAMADPDYFIDCYEVVKELKDDGIILAGREIGRGGLLCGLARLTKACGTGMEVDILPLQNAFGCKDATEILFNEIPGVLIAISDEDYGYIDTQMILQDIAYYPVGFATEGGALKIRHKLDYNVADLLLPLINRNI